MKLYGIANCTTVKKARAWLDARGVEYVFVDVRKTPPAPETLRRWVARLGWEAVLNRRGTTWRTLGPQLQAGVQDEASAIAAMRAHPTLIKRPVIETAADVLVGFDDHAFAAHPSFVGRRRA